MCGSGIGMHGGGVCGGGHTWQGDYLAGRCAWQGGHAWQGCYAQCGGVWHVWWRGHAWQWGGCAWSPCMMEHIWQGGHAWQGGMYGGRCLCWVGHVWGMHGVGPCMAGDVCERGAYMNARRDSHCSGWYASYWNTLLSYFKFGPDQHPFFSGVTV